MAYEKKTKEQVKANIVLNLVTNVDEINDANIGSVLDYFATGNSVEFEELYDDMDLIYQGTRVSTAEGEDLEELGLIVGVTRNTGSKASGTVSFVRNSPAPVEFTIPAGSIVATQPNTENIQYQFSTTVAGIFKTAIADEEHTFRNGVYQYKLDQRFVNSVSAIDGTAGAAPQTFLQGTDYSLVEDFNGYILDLTNFSMIEDCETIGNWTEGDEALAPTANTSEYYEGTQSINMTKTGTTSTLLSYASTLVSVIDLTDEQLLVMLYIKDAAALAKISQADVYACSGGSTANSYQMTYEGSELVVGWNRLVIDRTSSDTTLNGNPDTVNINYLKIKITTNNTTDTFIAGDLMMDMWFKAQEVAYQGDLIQWDKSQTIPDDNTTFETDYVPLSLEIPVESEDVGVVYNVSKMKIVYKVTNLTNIDRIGNYSTLSGGLDIESDDSFRDRVQNAAQLQSSATAEAIRYNVLALDFVGSVVVVDTPDKSASNENIVYNTGVDKYTLAHEVAQNNGNLKIGDTPGATDYTNGVDYTLTVENEIDWGIGGTNPSNGATFYVSYDYKWLGHFTVYVVGELGQLTSSQLTQVQEVVDAVRSAGTVGAVTEPTYTDTDVDINLTVDPEYGQATVNANCTAAIEEYITNLGVGGDVLIAGIVNACMEIEGVLNVAVTDIGGGGASDYSIAADEVARPGVVTITNL